MKSGIPERVLAVDLWSRGFAYVVLDGPRHLLDWGKSRLGTTNKHDEGVTRLKMLLDEYEPDAVVMEDLEVPGCRRGEPVRALSRTMRRLALAQSLLMILIPWKLVRQMCGQGRKATKQQIAAWMAEQYLALKPRLPQPRKLWEAENEWMNVFDAAALGWTAYVSHGRRTTS